MVDLNKLGKALEKNGWYIESLIGGVLVAWSPEMVCFKWDGTGENWHFFGAIMGILEEKRVCITVRPHFKEFGDVPETGYMAVHSPVAIECLPSVNLGDSYTAAASLALIEVEGIE